MSEFVKVYQLQKSRHGKMAFSHFQSWVLLGLSAFLPFIRAERSPVLCLIFRLFIQYLLSDARFGKPENKHSAFLLARRGEGRET